MLMRMLILLLSLLNPLVSQAETIGIPVISGQMIQIYKSPSESSAIAGVKVPIVSLQTCAKGWCKVDYSLGNASVKRLGFVRLDTIKIIEDKDSADTSNLTSHCDYEKAMPNVSVNDSKLECKEHILGGYETCRVVINYTTNTQCKLPNNTYIKVRCLTEIDTLAKGDSTKHQALGNESHVDSLEGTSTDSSMTYRVKVGIPSKKVQKAVIQNSSCKAEGIH